MMAMLGIKLGWCKYVNEKDSTPNGKIRATLQKNRGDTMITSVIY
jgi:hypothetical protein